jgi:hypothetical protein
MIGQRIGTLQSAVARAFQSNMVSAAETKAAPALTGPVEVLVVFPEPAGDAWAPILAEEKPRPKLVAAGDEAQAEHRGGRTKPLDFRQL